MSNYQRWIEEEEETKQKKKQEVSKMEVLELNLIKKL